MYSQEASIEKVSAFILRERNGEKEILLFQPAHAGNEGIQVPAGTVEAGESLEEAVLREAWEESSLRTKIVRALGIGEETPQDEAGAFLIEGTVLRLSPYEGAEIVCWEKGETYFPRGWLVWFEEQEGAWTRICAHEFIPEEQREVLVCGWVPTRLLARRVIRGFFELEALEERGDAWVHFAENRYNFELFWAPLSNRPRLAGIQESWMAYLDPLLLKE